VDGAAAGGGGDAAARSSALRLAHATLDGVKQGRQESPKHAAVPRYVPEYRHSTPEYYVDHSQTDVAPIERSTVRAVLYNVAVKCDGQLRRSAGRCHRRDVAVVEEL